jgi:CO dehydrogenase maturation factor
MCASHRAVRGLIAELSGYGEHTVTDMEAGLEHMKRGTARNVDVMLIVAEPYYRSLEAAERTYSLARELAIPHIFVVANKIKSDADQKAVDEFCARHGMPIIGTVPHDDELIEAERRALAPIDHAPDCAGVRAVVAIADKLRALPSPGRRQPPGLAARPQT